MLISYGIGSLQKKIVYPVLITFECGSSKCIGNQSILILNMEKTMKIDEFQGLKRKTNKGDIWNRYLFLLILYLKSEFKHIQIKKTSNSSKTKGDNPSVWPLQICKKMTFKKNNPFFDPVQFKKKAMIKYYSLYVKYSIEPK